MAVRRRHKDKQAGETTLPLGLPVNSTINVAHRIVKQFERAANVSECSLDAWFLFLIMREVGLKMALPKTLAKFLLSFADYSKANDAVGNDGLIASIPEGTAEVKLGRLA